VKNNSDKVWSIKADLKQDTIEEQEYFSIMPGSIAVSPGELRHITLSFTPAWKCKVEGMLKITNMTT
jgi:hypothetical protein